MRPEIVLGCPGAGKTTALLDILDGELVRGVEPERIGFVSFTRKAASEAVTRACVRFGLTRKRFPHFRTLHSFCFRQLGLRRGNVFAGPRLLDFADWSGIRVTGRQAEDGVFSGFAFGDRILHMDNLARVRCLQLRAEYDHDDDGLPWREVERAAAALVDYKRECGLLDYTDMLAEFLVQGTVPALKVLLVDEAQDLSALQWRVVEAIWSRAERAVVAGDDDQAIFEWSGADVSYLVQLVGSRESILGESHRVPRAVQELASQIISPVRQRRAKTWRARGELGTVARARDFTEVSIDDEDTGGPSPPVLVLARNSYVLRNQVEPELRRRGIYYEYHGMPSVPRALLDAIMNWEKLRRGEAIPFPEAKGIYRWMKVGHRGRKELTGFRDDEQVDIGALRARGGLLAEGPWFEALDRVPEDDVGYIRQMLQQGEKLRARPRVRVSTIHVAKGGEAEHVVLFKEMARRTYRDMEENPDAERRVWYVGATRARTKLTIVESQTRQACPWI